MVIVLQDGSRWKIDPNKTLKLCQLIQPDQIMRFECIFSKRRYGSSKKSFEQLKREFSDEMKIDSLNLKEAGFKDLDQCLRHWVRPVLVQPAQQTEACGGCRQHNGLQKLLEPQKFAKHLVIEVSKLHELNIFKFPEKLHLDKYTSSTHNNFSSSHYNQI